jgi:uncharacterized protein YggU (UPF0235/DUF167 family)
MSHRPAPLRIALHVIPGSSRTSVGGSRGDALVVRVTARPERGRATDAALRALAEALGVRPRDVRLVAGTTSRAKLVEVATADPTTATRLAALRSARE